MPKSFKKAEWGSRPMLIRVFKKDRVYGYDFRIKETLH